MGAAGYWMSIRSIPLTLAGAAALVFPVAASAIYPGANGKITAVESSVSRTALPLFSPRSGPLAEAAAFEHPEFEESQIQPPTMTAVRPRPTSRPTAAAWSTREGRMREGRIKVARADGSRVREVPAPSLMGFHIEPVWTKHGRIFRGLGLGGREGARR